MMAPTSIPATKVLPYEGWNDYSCAVHPKRTDMQQVVENLAGGKLLSISPSFQAATTIRRLTTVFVILFLQLSSSRITTAEDTSHKDAATLISKENLVDSSRPPAQWRSATVVQQLIAHDRVRNGEDSGAAVRYGGSNGTRNDQCTYE